MEPIALRPLDIGEVLDVAIKLYRQHFKTLMKAVAVVVVPVQILSGLIQSSSSPNPDSFVTPAESPDGMPSIDTGQIWTFVAGLLIVGLLTFIAGHLASGAAIRIVSQAYLGSTSTWQESLRFAGSRLGPLIWLSIIESLILGVGFLLCIVPGIYLAVAFSVSIPALLLENQRGTRALGRSRRLVKGRGWQVAATLFLSWMLASIVSGVLSGLLVGVTVTNAGTVVSTIVRILVAIASSILTTPFSAAVVIVLYFDLRVRKEGFDLLLLAQQIGVDPPPAVAP